MTKFTNSCYSAERLCIYVECAVTNFREYICYYVACRRTNPSFVCIPYFEPCHQGMWDDTVNFNVCPGGCLV